jgi:streptogramin lyase
MMVFLGPPSIRPTGGSMNKKIGFTLLALLTVAALAFAAASTANNAVDVPQVEISGKVTDDQGNPLRGVLVTAYDADAERSVTVSTKPDGTYTLAHLPMDGYKVRARQIGRADAWKEIGHVHDKATGVDLALSKVSGLDLQWQRTGADLLGLMKWEDEKDALNFKMMCTYCHQVGTLGFRSPEEPVDWDVMLTRMDGFAGLYEHTQKTLLDRIFKVYGREAEQHWPEFTPPEPPSGDALRAEVREWSMGKENDAMIHDLELGMDGLVYTVDMTADAIETLDPATGERHVYSIPGGKAYDSFDPPIKGPHSLEMDAQGHMWVTLALSGQMAKFDTKKKEWEVVPGAPAPRPRGGYPHTLRIDQKGIVWFTDAAGWVSSLDPSKYDAEAKRYEIKMYQLPNANQVRGGGTRGESRGVTPYGIDIAPNGHVWYGKLNGQRLGRIAPELADDDPQKIVEWEPPVHGPRRFHVAPNGIVWVPGWASGDLASFDPSTEEWAVYPLPQGPDSLPYALNVEPKTGHVWICGTGTDSMLRFDPKSQTFTEYLMPTRVTYTREVEFDDEGNVWVTNSNYPVRHVENGYGSVIRISTM